MKKINNRLTEKDINNILKLLKTHNKLMTEHELAYMCSGKNPDESMTLIYGIYEGEELVSVMVASYFIVSPHPDNPRGRIVHWSGAYTREDKRRKGYSAQLLASIEEDAKTYFNADYLCGDCVEVGKNLALSQGFKMSDEYRVWKPL